MGTIQSAVNSTITSAAALASLNPAIQEKAKVRNELKNLEYEQKNLSDQTENLLGEMISNPKDPIISKELDRLQQRAEDNITQQYILNPKDKNLAEKYFEIQRRRTRDEIRMQMANEAAQKQNEIKKSQKRNFNNHLNNINAEGGKR